MLRNIKTVDAAQGLHVIGKLGPDFDWAVCHPAHTISFSSLAYTRCLTHTHTHTLWNVV